MTTNILPTNEATLPTFTCSASSNHENTKIVPMHEMSRYIAEPRIFWYIQSLAGHTPQTDSSKYNIIQLVLTFGLLNIIIERDNL